MQHFQFQLIKLLNSQMCRKAALIMGIFFAQNIALKRVLCMIGNICPRYNSVERQGCFGYGSCFGYDSCFGHSIVSCWVNTFYTHLHWYF